MTKQTIIGLTGPAGCGKNTVADLLTKHLGFVQCAFADPLRREIEEAFSIDPALLTDRRTKEHPTLALALSRCADQNFVAAALASLRTANSREVFEEEAAARSPRQIMQWWGTEYRRQRHAPDYWSRQLSSRVYVRQQAGHQLHIITDVRFPNEANTIECLGGQIWQIKRPGYGAEGDHASATTGSMFRPAVVIDNAHDTQYLQAMVLGALFQQQARITAADLVYMGLSHVSQANAEWSSKGPTSAIHSAAAQATNA